MFPHFIRLVIKIKEFAEAIREYLQFEMVFILIPSIQNLPIWAYSRIWHR